MAENKAPLIVMGRMLGTYSGWDQSGDSSWCYYNFLPAPNVKLPPGTLDFDWDQGTFSAYNDDEEPIFRVDALEILRELPRQEELRSDATQA